MATDIAPSSTVFRERLWPGPLGWSFVLGFAAFVLVAVLPVHEGAAFAASAAAVVLGLAVAVRTATVVTVSDGELRAGRAHIPVAVLGTARSLDRGGVRAALGPGSDARAFACLRSWIPGAVEVQVEDPADPTPTWLVSTRRPSDLVAAIETQKASQAAHSEQID